MRAPSGNLLLFSPFLQLANFENIEQNVVLTAREMIFATFE